MRRPRHDARPAYLYGSCCYRERPVMPRIAKSLVRRVLRRRRLGGRSPCRLPRALRPSGPTPSPARCTARLSGKATSSSRSLRSAPWRNHAPAITYERRSRPQLTALLLRNGDEVPRRRPLPEPHLAAELQVHPIRIRASQPTPAREARTPTVCPPPLEAMRTPLLPRRVLSCGLGALHGLSLRPRSR